MALLCRARPDVRREIVDDMLDTATLAKTPTKVKVLDAAILVDRSGLLSRRPAARIAVDGVAIDHEALLARMRGLEDGFDREQSAAKGLALDAAAGAAGQLASRSTSSSGTGRTRPRPWSSRDPAAGSEPAETAPLDTISSGAPGKGPVNRG